MAWLVSNWKVFALLALAASFIGYGEFRYRNGWYAHSDKVNAEYVENKQRAEIKLAPTEERAATANAEGKVIYKTITRDVVKYVQDPNRTVCRFDDDAVSMRQRAINAANNIAGFDDATVQAKSGGK